MRRRLLWTLLITCLVALPCAAQKAEPTLTSGWAQKITMEFKDTPLRDAITALFKDTPISVNFNDDVPRSGAFVTMTLRDIERKDALRALCEPFGLDSMAEGIGRGLWVLVISSRATDPVSNLVRLQDPRPASATAAQPAPIRIEAPTMNYVPRRSTVPGSAMLTLPAGPGMALPAYMSLMCDSFKGDDCLVDLEVKDATVSEAMAQVSKACKVPIHVHDSVSKEVKVSAKMYRMPLREMLCLIVGQANLIYTVGYAPDPDDVSAYKAGLIDKHEFESRRGKPEIYIVPKSELTVSGPGVPGGTVSLTLPRSDIDGQRRLQEATEQLLGRTNFSTTGESPLVECPKCHRKVPRVSDWKFCPYCGAQLPPPKGARGAKAP